MTASWHTRLCVILDADIIYGGPVFTSAIFGILLAVNPPEQQKKISVYVRGTVLNRRLGYLAC
jgi:hypothetical protein